jgi:hypothetical protein
VHNYEVLHDLKYNNIIKVNFNYIWFTPRQGNMVKWKDKKKFRAKEDAGIY